MESCDCEIFYICRKMVKQLSEKLISLIFIIGNEDNWNLMNTFKGYFCFTL